MIKYKYLTLTRAEKKAAKKEFWQTERGKDLKIRTNRLLIYSVLLLGFGIWILVDAIIKNDSIAKYIYSAIIIIFALVFIIGRYIVTLKQVNNYIVKNPKKKR